MGWFVFELIAGSGENEFAFREGLRGRVMLLFALSCEDER